jgi:hypothetical protein
MGGSGGRTVQRFVGEAVAVGNPAFVDGSFSNGTTRITLWFLT